MEKKRLSRLGDGVERWAWARARAALRRDMIRLLGRERVEELDGDLPQMTDAEALLVFTPGPATGLLWADLPDWILFPLRDGVVGADTLAVLARAKGKGELAEALADLERRLGENEVKT